MTGLTPSPITGAKGNVEHLILIDLGAEARGIYPDEEAIDRTVAEAMEA